MLGPDTSELVLKSRNPQVSDMSEIAKQFLSAIKNL